MVTKEQFARMCDGRCDEGVVTPEGIETTAGMELVKNDSKNTETRY